MIPAPIQIEGPANLPAHSVLAAVYGLPRVADL